MGDNDLAGRLVFFRAVRHAMAKLDGDGGIFGGFCKDRRVAVERPFDIPAAPEGRFNQLRETPGLAEWYLVGRIVNQSVRPVTAYSLGRIGNLAYQDVQNRTTLMPTSAVDDPAMLDAPIVTERDEAVDASADQAERVDVSRGVGILDVVDREGRLPPFPVPWRHPIRAVIWVVRTLFGLASLTVLLAVVAAIPLVNFLALGYLLEVEGRVGRSGRIRDAFPLLNAAPRIGAITIGIWLWMLPLRLLASAASDAQIINPGGPAAGRLNVLLSASWALITLHVCLALARGGSLTCFLRPIKNVRWLWSRISEGDYFDAASNHVRAFVERLRLRHHFWLGLRGFVGAMAWLLIPTAIFAFSDGTNGAQVATTLIGGVLLAIVLAWVPFLQARLATEERLRSMFALREVRRLFTYAPIAWLVTILVVYVLALPLYLFKAFVLPADAMWPITLIFVASIYPARVLTGWAYHRAVRKRAEEKRSHWTIRWLCRLAIIPLLAAFVFILHFTQFIGVNGTAGLFEHHAFLLPWAGAPTL